MQSACCGFGRLHRRFGDLRPNSGGRGFQGRTHFLKAPRVRDRGCERGEVGHSGGPRTLVGVAGVPGSAPASVMPLRCLGLSEFSVEQEQHAMGKVL